MGPGPHITGQQVAAMTSVVNCGQRILRLHVTEAAGSSNSRWQQQRVAATAGSMIDVGQSGNIFIGDR